jgi:glycosyltransferase involved in cell wall biosynthesis
MEVNHPIISILMPVFNESKHLDACIQSIRAQSYPYWELIAVNDGSTDNSASILNAWSQLDSRIHWFNNCEKGIIPALKLAFTKSKGVFIHRMDADDIMLREKLQHLIKIKNNSNSSLSTGKIKYAGLKLKRGFLDYEQWVNDQSAQNFWVNIYYECPLISPCWLADRSLVEEYLSHTDLMYPEDYFFAFFLYSKRIVPSVSSDYLHIWRDHDTRASRIDDHYLEQAFLPLKLHFLFNHDRDTRPLLLWGAGRKGKALAQMLKKMNKPFLWTSNNPEKVGKQIYSIEILPEPSIHSIGQYQTILAFSAPSEKEAMQLQLDMGDLMRNQDYFWFY